MSPTISAPVDDPGVEDQADDRRRAFWCDAILPSASQIQAGGCTGCAGCTIGCVSCTGCGGCGNLTP